MLNLGFFFQCKVTEEWTFYKVLKQKNRGRMAMDVGEILKKNQQWVNKKLEEDSNYFIKLSKGQSPEILYIGCSDSRVSAENMLGAEPGELFVHRNVANQIIATDANSNAVVHYAVEHLKVKHIVVCGHYECGGINAALYPEDLGQLNNWLLGIRDVYRMHSEELNAISNKSKRFDRFVELNVLEQAMNVMKLDHVQRAWHKTGSPRVHGWVFNLRNGKVIDLKVDMEKEFSKIRGIYDLNLNTKN